jgi:hypothetical protein
MVISTSSLSGQDASESQPRIRPAQKGSQQGARTAEEKIIYAVTGRSGGEKAAAAGPSWWNDEIKLEEGRKEERVCVLFKLIEARLAARKKADPSYDGSRETTQTLTLMVLRDVSGDIAERDPKVPVEGFWPLLKDRLDRYWSTISTIESRRWRLGTRNIAAQAWTFIELVNEARQMPPDEALDFLNAPSNITKIADQNVQMSLNHMFSIKHQRTEQSTEPKNSEASYNPPEPENNGLQNYVQ